MVSLLRCDLVVRALATLRNDQIWVSNITWWLTMICPEPGNPMPSSDLHSTRHMCSTDAHMKQNFIHIIFLKKLICLCHVSFQYSMCSLSNLYSHFPPSSFGCYILHNSNDNLWNLGFWMEDGTELSMTYIVSRESKKLSRETLRFIFFI